MPLQYVGIYKHVMRFDSGEIIAGFVLAAFPDMTLSV